MKMRLEKPALLVIDVQNYFFDPGAAKYLKDSRPVVSRINRLLRKAVASGWPIIFTSHRAPRRGSQNLMAHRYPRLPRGRECRIWKELEMPPASILITKEHYSAFQGTGLAARLRRRGIKSIVLCGAMTHLCVDTTARQGFMLGFRPVVVSDACCSKSPAYHRAALMALGHGFADILRTSDIEGYGKNN